MDSAKSSIYIFGAGKVGTSLAAQFQAVSIPIIGLLTRNRKKCQTLTYHFPETPIDQKIDESKIRKAQIILITVQDDNLSAAVNQLVNLPVSLEQKFILHTSGSHSSQLLYPLKTASTFLASFHPNFAFQKDIYPAGSLKGIYFDIEGDELAIRICRTLTKAIGAKSIVLAAEQKMAMHIAATIYSNFFVILANMAQSVLQKSDIQKEYFWKPFLPLIQSTESNLSEYSPQEALTGPLVRGDVKTLENHLNFLQRNIPSLTRKYIDFAEYALEFISLPAEKQKAIYQIFQNFKNSN